MADYDAPNEPFMEVWGFYLSFRQRPPMTRSAMSIRYRVLSHLEGTSREKAIDELPEDLASLNLIQSTLRDLAEDHLCCPEYDFFFANYEETDGSLDVGFEIAVVFFSTGSGYSTFRTGLDSFYKDLKKLLKGVEGLKVRTRRRFSRRKVAGRTGSTTPKNQPAKRKKR